MEINEKNAKEMFREKFKGENGFDFAGREMHYSQYGNNLSPYGWNVDHILPEKKNGSDDKVNLQCTNIVTNSNKGDKTTWQDLGKTWQVKKVKGNKKKHIVVELEQ